MTDEAMAETMADDIWTALAPLRHFHDNYDEGMSFDKYHEEAEFLLMSVLDKWYGAGFKDGCADERMVHEMDREYREDLDERP